MKIPLLTHGKQFSNVTASSKLEHSVLDQEYLTTDIFMVGRKLLQRRDDVQSFLLLAAKEQVTRRLRKEDDHEQCRQDKKNREGDWEPPRDRQSVDERKAVSEPVSKCEAESNARAETDKQQRATTVCLEALRLPSRDGRCKETTMISMAYHRGMKVVVLPIANTGNYTSSNILTERES